MKINNFILTLKSIQLFHERTDKLTIDMTSCQLDVLNVIDKTHKYVRLLIRIDIGDTEKNRIAQLVIAYQMRIELPEDSEINKKELYLQMKPLYFSQINSLLSEVFLPHLNYEGLDQLYEGADSEPADKDQQQE
ncbi:MAG: hypothetical protein M0P01_08515 [Treponema sp.]|nr:hypothetical protein [Treponema sp.]